MKKNKNIFYLSYDGLLDPLGLSQIVPYLHLINNHYNLEVISFEKKNKLNETNFINVRNQLLDKNIKWKYYKYNNSILLNLIKIVLINFYIFFKITKKEYIFHLRSYIPYFYLILPNFFYKIEFIFDMRGFWFQEKIDRRNWNSNSILINYLSKFEKIIIAKSKKTLCLTDTSIKYLLNKYPKFNNNKFIRIRTTVNHKKFVYKKKQVLFNNIIFCYLGTTDGAYDFDLTLKIFLKFKEFFPNCKIKIISNDSINLINKKIKKNNLNIKDYEIMELNYNEVPEELNKSDLGIFNLKNNLSIKASFPTKISEYFICNKPIICNKFNDDIAKIINTKLGMIINHPNELSMNKKNKLETIILDNLKNEHCINYAKKNLINDVIINQILESYK